MRRYLPLAMLLTVWLGGCGPETLPPAGSGQAGDIVVQETTRATPQATAVSPLPSPQPSPEMTVVEPSVTATALPEPVQFPEAPTPTLIPTPDMNATTVPELDGIALVNPKLLPLSKEVLGAIGNIIWSPDGRHYAGSLRGSLSTDSLRAGETSRTIRDIYLGDAETRELVPWQHNGSWPAWSRDGRYIYYLALRADQDRFFYDLHRRSLESTEADLIVEDLSGPGFPQPSVAETADGNLVVLDGSNQPAVISHVGDNPETVTIASLVGKNSIANPDTGFSLSPDGHTLAVIPFQEPMYLVDLSTTEVITEFDDTARVYDNVAWSPDGTRFAYATGSSVRIYDLHSKELHNLVTLEDMGIANPLTKGSLAHPRWSPNGDVVLFLAASLDWSFDSAQGYRDYGGVLFAATEDGSHMKAISRYFFDDVSPDGTRAIVTDRSSETQRESKYLVDVVWNDGS